MTAVLSPTTPSSSSHHGQGASPNPNAPHLPPINTSHQKRTALQRPPSYAAKRMSSYSTTSNASQKPSRPPSHIFPVFHLGLGYTQVRDFSYPTSHPLHHGPPADPSAAQSGRSTPIHDVQNPVDPPLTPWDTPKSNWTPGTWGGVEQLPQMAYGEDTDDRGGRDHGPPYSEDEDLQSPVVVSSRHKKWGSFPAFADQGKPTARAPRRSDAKKDSRGASQGRRSYLAGTNGDGSETYYVSEANETADGPGGELVTYPTGQRQNNASLSPNLHSSPRGGIDQRRASLEPGSFNTDESRYSRDYQFSIASPDEEMHGKAVALFDFARENENELPLVEGQVIWVSYRHGQGWLVAEDPKTRESGLVPEEYVRLLRDIEGGLNSLSGESNATDEIATIPSVDGESPVAATPISTSADSGYGHSAQNSSGSNGEKHKPVLSTFSTSSKDLNPYPHPLLGTQTGQPPPAVVHYGSQANTPTLMSPGGIPVFRRITEEGSSRRRVESRDRDVQMR